MIKQNSPTIPLPEPVPQPSMVFDTTVVTYEAELDDVVVMIGVGVAVMTVSVGWEPVVTLEPVGVSGLLNVIVVLEMTMIEYITDVELEVMNVDSKLEPDTYGIVDGNDAELDESSMVGVRDMEEAVDVVMTTVVPVMTVTIVRVVVDRDALLRMGSPEFEDEDSSVIENDDEDGDENGDDDVLEATIWLNLDVVDAVVVMFAYNTLEVDVGLKTPEVAVKDVELVPFARHDAGMVKQHGRPVVEDETGSKAPL